MLGNRDDAAAASRPEPETSRAKRRRCRHCPGLGCTALVATAAIAPLGGLVFQPLALIGAAVVLFSIIVAAVGVHH